MLMLYEDRLCVERTGFSRVLKTENLILSGNHLTLTNLLLFQSGLPILETFIMSHHLPPQEMVRQRNCPGLFAAALKCDTQRYSKPKCQLLN